MLETHTINAGYIYLCRPCPFTDIKQLTDKEIAKAVRGFDSKNTFTLFTEIDDDSSSAVNDNIGITSGPNSEHQTPHGQQPRLHLKRNSIKNNKDSDTQERASADSQYAVTPVLGAMQQKKDS